MQQPPPPSSSQRASGLRAPVSRIARTASGISKPGGSSSENSRAQSAIEKSARAAGLTVYAAERYAIGLLDQIKGPEPAPKEPTDGFKIGDRVWIAGNRPGAIAFIGETQFSTGEWAGVVLSGPVGKNDGSVLGVRYFQCDAKCGVFSRLSKLSRYPIDNTVSISAGVGHTLPSQVGHAFPSQVGHALPSHVGNSSSIKVLKPPPMPSVAAQGQTIAPNVVSGIVAATQPSKSLISIGDSIIVSGTKRGILRYLGTTDFAKGEWAGVELLEPSGKNDGAVAGKRYFSCKQNHGLFAPKGKVVKIVPPKNGAAAAAPPSYATTSTPSGILTTPRRPSIGMRSRSGSIESISSIGSAMSSMSTRSARQYAASERLTRGRPSLTNSVLPPSLAIQKALKEKEEHIDQLLRERDQEREDMIAANERFKRLEFGELQNEFDELKEKYEQKIVELNRVIDGGKTELSDLQAELDDERRKVENISFSLDERKIVDEDTEKQLEDQLARIEDDLRSSQIEVRNLKVELTKANETNSDISATNENDKSLMDKIKELEVIIENYKKQVELAETQSKRLQEMETLLKKSKINQAVLQDKIIEYEVKMKTQNELNESLSNTNKDLEKDITSALSGQGDIGEQMQSLYTKLADKERELQASIQGLSTYTEEQASLRSAVGERHADDLEHLQKRLAEDDQAHVKVIGEKESEVATLTSDLEAEKLCRQDLLERFTILQSKHDSQDSRADNLEKSIQEKEGELKSINDEKITQSHKIIELETKITDFINSAKEEKSNFELIKNNLDESEKISEDLKINIEVLKKKSEQELLSAQALLNDNEANQSKAQQNLSDLNKERDSLICEKEGLITSLQLDLKHATTASDDLTTKYNELNVEYNDIAASNKSNISIRSDVESKLKISCEQLTQITDKNNELITRIEDLMKNSGDSSEQMNFMNSKLMETEKSLLESQNLQISTKCNLENQLSNKSSELDETNAEHVKQLKIVEEKYTKSIKNQYEDLELIQGQLKQSQDALSTNETDAKHLNENIETERKSNVELEAKLKDFEIKLSLYIDNETSLKEKNNILEDRMFDLTETNLNKDGELSTLKEQVILSNSEMNELIELGVVVKSDLEDEVKAICLVLEALKLEHQNETLETDAQHTLTLEDKNKEIEVLTAEISEIQELNSESISKLQSENSIRYGENEKYVNLLKNKVDELNEEVAITKKALDHVEVELFEVVEEITTIKTSAASRGQENDNEASKRIAELTSQLKDMTSAFSKKKEDFTALEQELGASKDNKEALNSQNQENILKLGDSDKQIDLYRSQVLEAKEKVEQLQFICEQQTLQNDKEREECNSWSEMFKNIKTELENVMPKFTELQEKLKMSELEANDLRILVDESASQTTMYNKINEDKNNLLEKMTAMKASYSSNESAHRDEAAHLRDELKENKNSLSIKDDQITRLQKEINDTMKSSINKPHMNSNNNTSSEITQIEFLNSVIADCTRKNDLLQEKLDVMNNIPDLNNSSFIDIEAIKSTTSMRLFCDICEVFDLHDTEECPTQCNDEEEVNHSHYHGDPEEKRPYCISCEIFGHTKDSCNDEQTF